PFGEQPPTSFKPGQLRQSKKQECFLH
ncbi:hypothetical protein GCK32_017726, partial [Trichostrongylus colubriformis]